MAAELEAGNTLSTPGHRYEGIHVTGGSTAYFGHNYFSAAESSTQSIETWISAPGSNNSYELTLNKYELGTGVWFTEGQQFSSWQQDPMSLIWLHGMAGCGKTVLAARVIQHLMKLRQTRSDMVVAYHFFSFRDRSTLHATSMLRALLAEVIKQAEGSKEAAKQVRASLNGDFPSLQDLLRCFRAATNDQSNFYFVIDAIDECGTSYADRDEVLDTISTIAKWAIPRVHILVVSRDHPDISTAMQSLNAISINMEVDNVSADIATYIQSRMTTDAMLKRWGPYNQHIKTKLVAGSGGIFRWAECQLRSLRQCPTSARHLQKCLESLPKDLYSTYEQMLHSVGEDFREDSRRLLSLLCFAERQMSSEEVLEALAVDLNPPAKFDPALKMLEADDLRRLCPDLVDIVSLEPGNDLVRISHSSIRDYLISSQIKVGKMAYFQLLSDAGVAQLCEICLVYIKCITDRPYDDKSSYLLRRSDFAAYAATHWHDHYLRIQPSQRGQLNEVLLQLFVHVKKTIHILRQSCVRSIRHRLHIRNPAHATSVYFDNWEEGGDPSIYYAASLGLNEIITMLHPKLVQINSQGGVHGTPLMAAIIREHPETAIQLLSLGAEATRLFRGGSFRCPLIEAAKRGYHEVVELLWEQGAQLNGVDEHGNTALCSAVQGGHSKAVAWLLEHGAHVDAVNGAGDTPLKLACFGHRDIVSLLLQHSATPPSQQDVTAMLAARDTPGDQVGFAKILADLGFYDGNALIHAASGGNLELVETLLAQGFDVNKTDDDGETALYRAVRANGRDIVQKLLDKGAKIDATADLRYNTIGVAILFGSAEILSLLLGAGANPNCAMVFDVSVYAWLGQTRFNDIAQVLLGADYFDAADIINPLHLAIATQQMNTVETLLQHGADVNAQAERGSPLHLAIYADHEGILQVLLNRGPDTKIRGQFGTPLETAQAFGLMDIEFMILRHSEVR